MFLNRLPVHLLWYGPFVADYVSYYSRRQVVDDAFLSSAIYTLYALEYVLL